MAQTCCTLHFTKLASVLQMCKHEPTATCLSSQQPLLCSASFLAVLLATDMSRIHWIIFHCLFKIFSGIPSFCVDVASCFGDLPKNQITSLALSVPNRVVEDVLLFVEKPGGLALTARWHVQGSTEILSGLAMKVVRCLCSLAGAGLVSIKFSSYGTFDGKTLGIYHQGSLEIAYGGSA